MEIGISSASFYPLETEKAVEELIRLGFHKAELFINSEHEYEPSYCKKLRAVLDDAGVEVISLHSYTAAIEGIYFFSAYSRRTEDSLKIYQRYFEAAQILGAKYFSFHGDRTISAHGYTSESVESHCEVFSRLAKIAAQHGVLVTQENVSWCASSNPEYVRLLRENLGEEIGFTLDLKQARRAGIPWQTYAEAMGSRLVNLHVSDGLGEKTSLLPGCGEFDYHQFYGFLKKKNYLGDALIEVYRQDYGDYRELLCAKNYLEVELARK